MHWGIKIWNISELDDVEIPILMLFLMKQFKYTVSYLKKIKSK